MTSLQDVRDEIKLKLTGDLLEFELEDALQEIFEKNNAGEVIGGGTLLLFEVLLGALLGCCVFLLLYCSFIIAPLEPG